MNLKALNLATAIASTVATIALVSKSASANTYVSRPPEPKFDKPTGQWLLISGDDGTNFYALTPYNAAQTTDQNLYVNSAVIVQTSQVSALKFLQIDCGHLQYREVMPGYATYNRTLNPVQVPPESYAWRPFKQGTAFLEVGKILCEKAAGDGGLQWSWNGL